MKRKMMIVLITVAIGMSLIGCRRDVTVIDTYVAICPNGSYLVTALANEQPNVMPGCMLRWESREQVQNEFQR